MLRNGRKQCSSVWTCTCLPLLIYTGLCCCVFFSCMLYIIILLRKTLVYSMSIIRNRTNLVTCLVNLANLNVSSNQSHKNVSPVYMQIKTIRQMLKTCLKHFSAAATIRQILMHWTKDTVSWVWNVLFKRDDLICVGLKYLVISILKMLPVLAR